MNFRGVIAATLCVLLVFTLAACDSQSSLLEVRIAYVSNLDNTENTQVFSYVTRRIAGSEGERICRMVLQMAISDPRDDTLASIFPAKLSLLSVQISPDGVISVDYSKEYSQLTGVRQVLANYATALTIFALDSVDDIKITGVNISVEGAKLRTALTPGDIVDSTDFLRLREHTFQIYLPDYADNKLKISTFSVTISDAKEPAQSIVARLMQERRTDSYSGGIIPFAYPPQLQIRSRVCYLDFTKDFYALFQDMQEKDRKLRVYAIVNSICELPYIDRVRFLLDGKTLEANFFYGYEDAISPNFNLAS